jgi:hypothetical protein
VGGKCGVPPDRWKVLRGDASGIRTRAGHHSPTKGCKPCALTLSAIASEMILKGIFGKVESFF